MLQTTNVLDMSLPKPHHQTSPPMCYYTTALVLASFPVFFPHSSNVESETKQCIMVTMYAQQHINDADGT